MPKNIPVNHHTVAQSALRRFARGDQIARVNLSARHEVIVTNVRNVAAEKLFYLFTRPDGQPTLELEHTIGTWEGDWNRAIGSVEQHGIQGPEWETTRAALVELVAFQYLRTTFAREESRHQAAVLEEILATYGGLPADWTAWSPNVHLRTMLEVYPQAVQAIRARSLVIVRFTRRSLITSDNPVTLLPVPDADERTPLALGSNGGIYLPLARRTGLLLVSPTEGPVDPDHEIPGTTALANDLNQHVADRAHRYLFHHPDDDPLRSIDVPTEPLSPVIKYEVLAAPDLRISDADH